MNMNNIEKVSMPIVYIALSILLSSFCFGVYDKYLWLAVLSASLFFIVISLKNNIVFSLVIAIFFLMGLLINFNYYSLNPSSEFCENVKIVKIKSYCTVANFKGRKINLTNINQKFNLGKTYLVEGKFERVIDKENGSIGELEVRLVRNEEETLSSKLYDLREKIYKKLEKNVGKRKAALISSLAFGYSDIIDNEDKEEMRELGIVHAISVSGLHTALVFTVLNMFLNKKISLAILSVYVLFTGASASSLRALIMIIVLNLALDVRKSYNSLASISLSAMVFNIMSPYLIFETGFQLSYLATLGIILFSYKLQIKFYRLPDKLRGTLSVCLAAQIFTLPVLICSFNEYSIIFLLGNLFIVPLLNIIIIIGNMLVIAFFSQEVFDFLSYILLKLIKVFDYVTDIILDINIGNLVVNSGVIIIYLSILISIYFMIKGHKKFILLPVSAFISMYIYIYSPFLRINYLDYGGLLVSYRGDRCIITQKNNIDISKLKKITISKKSYRSIYKMSIAGVAYIEEQGKNYLLTLGENKFLLKISNKSVEDSNYGIINFISREDKGIFIFDEDIYIY